jgi:endonuclease YncB( thermonuclease family)
LGSLTLLNTTGTSNLAVKLVEEGFASMHFASASSTSYFQQIKDAEARAKAEKKGIWENDVVASVESLTVSEPKVVSCVVTEVKQDSLHLQFVDTKSAKSGDFKLAYIAVPEDYQDEYLDLAIHLLETRKVVCKIVGYQEVLLSVEGECSANEKLVREGLAYVRRGVKRNADTEPLYDAQKEARKGRKNAWQYGDFLDDEER